MQCCLSAKEVTQRSLRSRHISSCQKHAVAVAEEAVVLLDGVAIGGEHLFAAGEGADEHEQARLGQVEICEQSGDETELEAGRDEDFGFTGVG